MYFHAAVPTVAINANLDDALDAMRGGHGWLTVLDADRTVRGIRANLVRQMTGTFRHWVAVPAAMLIAVITLVGGQLILEHVFSLNTALSVIVNFVGGVYFIALLIRESRT